MKPDESRSARIDSRNPAIWFQLGTLGDAIFDLRYDLTSPISARGSRERTASVARGLDQTSRDVTDGV